MVYTMANCNSRWMPLIATELSRETHASYLSEILFKYITGLNYIGDTENLAKLFLTFFPTFKEGI